MCNKDRAVIYKNLAAERLTGRTLEETALHPCHREFSGPDQRCYRDCPIDTAIANGQPTRYMESTVANRYGKVVPVEVSITPLPISAGLQGAVVVLRDITRVNCLDDALLNLLLEFEKGARELKRHEARFRDFAELSNEWLWETDADQRFTLMTGDPFFAHELYIGYRRQDMVDIEADKARWDPFFERLENQQSFTDFVYPAPPPGG